MTLEQIENELTQIAENPGDNELDHSRADDLIVQALLLLGASEIAIAFTKARKEFWYA